MYLIKYYNKLLKEVNKLTIIKSSDSFQAIKECMLPTDAVEQIMSAQSSSCKGECNDCDNCGGSITH